MEVEVDYFESLKIGEKALLIDENQCEIIGTVLEKTDASIKLRLENGCIYIGKIKSNAPDHRRSEERNI